MKCHRCGTINDPKGKFCRECGSALLGSPENPSLATLSELYGKEVDILFFVEDYTGKISGIVNPTEDQVGRYRRGIRQRVMIGAGAANANTSAEATATLLAFIRQSKEYLSEDFKEERYRGLSPAELKKEYLHLFERILKAKAHLQETPNPAPEKKEKK